ncbi:MAG: hypothetical protein KGK00_02190 [Paracoccaceae bacterium]|nr:hypothetical protein [Paracoccaceae bacterium]
MNNVQKMVSAIAVLMISGASAANAANVNRVGWIGADSYLPFSLYSNVTTKDTSALLGGHVVVAEFQDGRSTGALRIAYYGSNGVVYSCGPHHGQNQVWHGRWEPFTIWGVDNIKYPVVKFIDPPKNLKQQISYGTLLYDAKSGGVTFYNFINGRYWRGNTGRIQKELPAVTWKVCPDFPSAASLGATVDPRQTATTYDAVIAQGGTPIRRPDLVTAHTEQKY